MDSIKYIDEVKDDVTIMAVKEEETWQRKLNTA